MIGLTCSLLAFAALASFSSLLLPRQQEPKQVIADYEDIFPAEEPTGLGNIFRIELVEEYKDLSYGFFAAFDNKAFEGMVPLAIARPNGKAGLGAFSGATISASNKKGSVESFKPSKFSFILYTGLGQSQSAATSGRITIRADFMDGSSKPENYEIRLLPSVLGKVQEFEFPSEWDAVTKLTITIEHCAGDTVTKFVDKVKKATNLN